MACELRHAGMLLLLLRALPGHLPAMCFVMCGADRVESSAAGVRGCRCQIFEWNGRF